MINKQYEQTAQAVIEKINAANDSQDQLATHEYDGRTWDETNTCVQCGLPREQHSQCERNRADRIARGISYSKNTNTLKEWLAARLDRNLTIDEWQRPLLIALLKGLRP